MSKVVVSPVAALPGSFTLVYPVPLDPYLEWIDISQEANDIKSIRAQIGKFLPAICGLIETASLEGLPAKPTPADFGKLKPGAAALELIIWLVGECRGLVAQEDNPNG